MLRRGVLHLAVALVFILSFALVSRAQTPPAKPELISPLGGKFYAQPDEKGVVVEAKKKLAAEPQNVDLIIALGLAQASLWRYHDAIETYTAALKLAPSNAMLYRHRGHRYISTRQFARAVADLEKAAQLNDQDFDIWYHLGLAYYLTGDFAKAAAAYERCRVVSVSDEKLVAVSDWLYMAYRRLNQEKEATQVLARIKPGMESKENIVYYNRLLFYQGLKTESELLNKEKPSDTEIATVGYGLANWYLYTGQPAKAREYFERIVAGKAWNAFGFIAAETELVRERAKVKR